MQWHFEYLQPEKSDMTVNNRQTSVMSVHYTLLYIWNISYIFLKWGTLNGNWHLLALICLKSPSATQAKIIYRLLVLYLQVM